MDSDHGRQASSQAWDKLYRADLFADVRFPDGHVFEDIATTHRLVMRAGRVACVPDALVHYREREGSISKQHSVANLVDYWQAYLQRYEELEGISEECRQACVRGCLNAISRTWCWWASCPAGERAESRGHVDAMRSFARDHTREVLRGGYSLGDKVRCLVGRHASPVVWVPMGALNRLRHVFTRRRGLYP